MHGNVYEWCLDWYVADLGTSAVTDPKGAMSGFGRLLGGGNWDFDNASLCRSAYRYGSDPSDVSNFIGFRACVLRAPVQ
jgi:formylglycine-generating enzyme required for sulfatase activity